MSRLYLTIVNLAHICLAAHQRSQSQDIRVPRSMQIVRHEAEEVDIWLHSLCVKVSKVPIVWRKSQTDAVLVSVSLSHLPDELCEVFSVPLGASSLRLHGVLPVQVDSREAVLVHEVGSRLNEGGPILSGGTQITPSRVCRTVVAKRVAANGDPSVCVESRKVLHQWNVGIIPGPDPEGIGVDGRKGEEQMGVVLSIDILGKDAVAQTVSAIGGQVIPNGPALSRSRALTTCLWSDDLARAKAFLARCELVWPDAVNLGCSTPST